MVKGTQETVPLAVTFAVMREHAACQTGKPQPPNPKLQRVSKESEACYVTLNSS